MIRVSSTDVLHALGTSSLADGLPPDVDEYITAGDVLGRKMRHDAMMP
jgi:hypothetical protein